MRILHQNLSQMGGVLGKFCLITLISHEISSVANAKDEILLDTIEITTHRLSAKQSRINSDKITKNIIIDENDLMRKEVGSSVAQGGRSGSNGYSMRGVDSNRISIKVDNMEAAQSFAPSFHQKQGFTSGVRGGTEIENLSTFHIDKGANSIMAGNGALGGAVSMQTKTAQDFVEDGKMLGIYSKFGYSSKNSEWREVLGAGFIVNGFEGLFQYTRRDGHETKTYYSDRINDKNRAQVLGTGDENKFYGSGRILPDPLTYSTNSYLAKLGYRFEDHFVNLFFESKNISNKIKEKSFPATGNNVITSDKTPYKRYGVQYEYLPFDSVIEELKFQMARQEIEQIYNQNSIILGGGDDIVRNTKTTQDKNQFDFSFNTTDLPLSKMYHSLYFGTGFGKAKFKNNNFWTSLKNKSITINGKKYKHNGNYVYARPITTDNFYLYLQDYAQINDKISSVAGLRFDRISHTLNKTDKFGAASGEDGAKITQAIWDMPNSKIYNKLTYNTGLKYEIFNDTMLGYNFSNGFKAPTIQESFVEFRDSKSYLSNFNLKPEIAYNHEIELSSNFDIVALSAVAFYTKYRNFIDYKIFDIREVDPLYGFITHKLGYQYQNINSAHIKGVELNARIGADLGYFGTFMASYQKGSQSDGSSLMAAQPFTMAFSFGYEAPKYSLSLFGKYQAKQSGKFYFYDDGGLKKKEDLKLKEFSTKAYFVADLLGEYRFRKNFKLSAGIFNIFDKNYVMWDTIRESKNNGTLSFIAAQEDHKASGLQRLGAPGRNFGISIEARF